MRTAAPDLLPIFRTRLQADLLARLFLFEPTGESLAELARQLRADPATVQREVERLERYGVLTSDRVGRTRVVRVDPDSPVYPELRALVLKALGPAPLLARKLADVEGIRGAYIFGSWARRSTGEPGPLPRDVDLLVVGEADPNAVYAAVREVEAGLGVEINPVVVSDEEWRHPLGLLERVKQGPLVELGVRDADDR
jgi:predicted nucleotidyltransferase